MNGQNQNADGEFPATRWTWLAEAGDQDDEKRLAALEAFLKLYYPALLRYARLQFRLPPDRAQDCLHDFILDKVMRKGLLARADRERGRFRTFLCHALNHHLVDQMRRSAAQKRAPAEGTVDLDLLSEEEIHRRLQSGQEQFDHAFFHEAIHETLRRMKSRCLETDRQTLWAIFEGRVLGEVFDDQRPVSYKKLVPLLGLDSSLQAANLLISAKRLFVRTLRSVVRDYTHSDEELAGEWKELSRILNEGGRDH